MGNFSRNTFDPLKNYVGVRLQQGVPVLDADWNELNDVTRQELYDAFSLTFADGTQPGGSDLEVQSRPEPNDFNILAGAALVRGRLVRVRNNLRYSTQPWTDPKRAARDGVAVIPPLTTPQGPPEGAPPRIDIVYLDVWDREVSSVEDPNLINPAIGVETCVRLKREAAVRVAEGATTLPTAPAGHGFLPLALLRRPRTQAQITSIEDRRSFFHSPPRVISFFPAFLPYYQSPTTSAKVTEWRIAWGGSPPRLRAAKVANEWAQGLLPLILPDGARLRSFTIHGDISATNGLVYWQLFRTNYQVAAEIRSELLVEDVIRSPSGVHVFGVTYGLSTEDPKLIVDNSRYHYVLVAVTNGFGYEANIDGVSFRYEYFGLTGPPTNP